MAYVLLFASWKSIQHLIFGELREFERKRLNDRLLKYILFKIVFVGSILEISSMSVLSIWAGWFSVLGFLKLFSLLSRDRFEYLVTYKPSTPLAVHGRIFALLVSILLIDALWFAASVSIFGPAGTSVYSLGETCTVLEWRGIRLMLDCGLHLPAMQRFLPVDAEPHGVGKAKHSDGKPSKRPRPDTEEPGSGEMPFTRIGGNVFIEAGAIRFRVPEWGLLDLAAVDAILISNAQNMLALPFITEHSAFRGRVYATEPTVQIASMMMQELVKYAEKVQYPEGELAPWQNEDLIACDHKLDLKSLPATDAPAADRSRRVLLGVPAIDAIIQALAERGIRDVHVENKPQKRAMVLTVDSLSASVLLSPTKTKITTTDEQARQLLLDIITSRTLSLS
ncbi:integrator complex subunit 9, putative [Acanthamoeba castellanii str. Neff]|uniref:Integrator complex subunit 9, putative n=1 Tax=Acanthamoeba castellanii (strain ATCC 30010 / Neff) TaxID=1257118 RepID=L8GE26_ACACF|nr:integrator complex subunit 9, putative [Acanthamoeba castellanii str. Neff]ELR11350.1 integrator complex subunit 9, putative [Acanthamoeba castellanii str. Neff]